MFFRRNTSSNWPTLSMQAMVTREKQMGKASEISTPRRHPAGGGYPRGGEARSRIIQIAIEAFGLHGYEGVSTRTIADLAGVKAPALQYYFGGKPGLYAACADHIAAANEARLASSLADARQALSNDTLPERSDPAAAPRASIRNTRHAAGIGCGGHGRSSYCASRRIRHRHSTACSTRSWGRSSGRAPLSSQGSGACLMTIPRRPSRALGFYGQITSFRFGREAVLRTLGTRELTNANRAQIKSGILRQLNALMR